MPKIEPVEPSLEDWVKYLNTYYEWKPAWLADQGITPGKIEQVLRYGGLIRRKGNTDAQA